MDFDLINGGQVRLSVGAVNVCKGTSTYFDTKIPLSTRTISEPVAPAAWLPAGDDRRGTLLGRRRGYQHANHLCGGRKTINHRPSFRSIISTPKNYRGI